MLNFIDTATPSFFFNGAFFFSLQKRLDRGGGQCSDKSMKFITRISYSYAVTSGPSFPLLLVAPRSRRRGRCCWLL